MATPSKSIYAPKPTRPVQELKSTDFKDPETELIKGKILPRHSFDSTAERLAKSKHFYVNYSTKGLVDLFHGDPDYTTVDYFFPYADGGPLYLDQVFSSYDYELLQAKHKKMIGAGFRHLVFEDRDEFVVLLDQLSVIDKTIAKVTKK